MASELDKELSTIRHILYLCWGTDCKKVGAKTLAKRIEQYVTEHELDDQVLVIRTKCVGQCEHAPLLCIQPDLAWYGPIKDKRLDEILETHLVKHENGATSNTDSFNVDVSQPELTKKRKK